MINRRLRDANCRRRR